MVAVSGSKGVPSAVFAGYEAELQEKAAMQSRSREMKAEKATLSSDQIKTANLGIGRLVDRSS